MSDSHRIFYGQESVDARPDFTGERFIPGVRGEIQVEHLHRYLFASRLVRGMRVLDIACGEGYGSRMLSCQAASVTGVDIDKQIIGRANEVHVSEKVSFLEGSCLAIPLEDDSVDAVVSFETIEHIEDHEGFMNEINRVLTADGLLIMSTPDTNAYVQESAEDNPYHLREMQRSEFLSFLNAQFDHTVFGSQRCVTGSVMMPFSKGDAGTTLFHRLNASEGSIEEVGELAETGVYLVGIATNGPLPKIDWGILDDPSFAMVEFMQLTHELAAQHVRINELQGEYETALKQALNDLDRIRRAPVVRIASRLGLAPRNRGVDG